MADTSLSGDDRYNYSSLSEESKQFCIEILGENPAHINAHIESFRRWLRSMPHLRCPTNAQFLINFLRVSKFEHSKAQARIDNFCTVRASSTLGSPEWFNYSQHNSASIDECMQVGHMLDLGLTDRQQVLLIMRPGIWDPDVIPFNKFFSVLYMYFDYLIVKYPQVSCHGATMLFDMQYFNTKMVALFRDGKLMKSAFKIWQDAYPIRHGSLIYYQEPAIFELVFNLISILMKPKLRNKIIRIGNDSSKLAGLIAGADRLLPADYGGHNKSIAEIIEDRKAEVKAYYSKGNPLACISVDESKRPLSAQNYLREYKDLPQGNLGSTSGMQGTITKLDC